MLTALLTLTSYSFASAGITYFSGKTIWKISKELSSDLGKLNKKYRKEVKQNGNYNVN